eukprot:TRINITY_DN5979_c0_g1_i1.p2 TRINITY_DN5979_c0_g1~~TRINITY_DN5979_c0_g1_i1.p2  ORF type:complete len:133 (+),score=23.92 TRINITY_DN5979_c0_g1_i1:64-462(+)
MCIRDSMGYTSSIFQMDKPEVSKEEIAQREKRLSVILSKTRCLDCSDPHRAIVEHSESPSCKEVRKVVHTLVRKGLSNTEIYEELAYTFGSHAIREKDMQDTKLYSFLHVATYVTPPSLLFGLLLFRRFRRR